MNLIEKLQHDRQFLATHLATMDEIIDKLSVLTSLTANGSSHTNGDSGLTLASFRRVPLPIYRLLPPAGKKPKTREIVAAVAQSWSKPRTIVEAVLAATDGRLTKGSIHTTISAMVKTYKELDRRGREGSYEYRATKRLRSTPDLEGMSPSAAALANGAGSVKPRWKRPIDGRIMGAATQWIRTYELHRLVHKPSDGPGEFKFALKRLTRLKQLERRGKPRSFEWRAKAGA